MAAGSDSSDWDSVEDALTRREVLATTGTALASGLAGCGGNGGEGNGTTVGETPTSTSEATPEETNQETTEETTEDESYNVDGKFPGDSTAGGKWAPTFVRQEDPNKQWEKMDEYGDLAKDLVLPGNKYSPMRLEGFYTSLWGTHGTNVKGEFDREEKLEQIRDRGEKDEGMYKGFNLLETDWDNTWVVGEDSLIMFSADIDAEEAIDSYLEGDTIRDREVSYRKVLDQLDERVTSVSEIEGEWKHPGIYDFIGREAGIASDSDYREFFLIDDKESADIEHLEKYVSGSETFEEGPDETGMEGDFYVREFRNRGGDKSLTHILKTR